MKRRRFQVPSIGLTSLWAWDKSGSDHCYVFLSWVQLRRLHEKRQIGDNTEVNSFASICDKRQNVSIFFGGRGETMVENELSDCQGIARHQTWLRDICAVGGWFANHFENAKLVLVRRRYKLKLDLDPSWSALCLYSTLPMFMSMMHTALRHVIFQYPGKKSQNALARHRQTTFLIDFQSWLNDRFDKQTHMQDSVRGIWSWRRKPSPGNFVAFMTGHSAEWKVGTYFPPTINLPKRW
jgi:hypothetical protein